MNENNENLPNDQINNDQPEDSSGEIRVIEEIVEGYWICPNCNAKNRGARQNCDACGAIRGENVEFLCDDDAEAITDEEELRKANAGPDWICPFCSNTSPAEAKNCTGCGSLRSDGKNRAVKEVPLKNEVPQKPAAEAKPKEARPMPAGIKIGCGVIALLFLILGMFSCQEKAGKLEITETLWTRTIERMEYKTVREEKWRNEVPANARELSSSRKIRSHREIPDGFHTVTETYTEKVKVGEKKVKDKRVSLGNGRFKDTYKMVPEYKNEKRTRQVKKQKYRKEPVFDEKVTYDADRWIEISPASAKGTTEEPKWPDAGLRGESSPKIGDIKEKSRSEVYVVKALRDGSKKEIEIKQLKDKPLSFEQFMKLRKGTKWDATFSGLGALKDIKLEPDKK